MIHHVSNGSCTFPDRNSRDTTGKGPSSTLEPSLIGQARLKFEARVTGIHDPCNRSLDLSSLQVSELSEVSPLLILCLADRRSALHTFCHVSTDHLRQTSQVVEGVHAMPKLHMQVSHAGCPSQNGWRPIGERYRTQRSK